MEGGSTHKRFIRGPEKGAQRESAEGINVSPVTCIQHLKGEV